MNGKQGVIISRDEVTQMSDLIKQIEEIVKERDATQKLLDAQGLDNVKGLLTLSNDDDKNSIFLPPLLVRRTLSEFVTNCNEMIRRLLVDLSPLVNK